MKFSSSAVVLCTFALISSFTLNSCHSTLYRAAKVGDVQTIREELKNGANPEGTASAANILWQIPAFPIVLTADVAQISAIIGTLGFYGNVIPLIYEKELTPDVLYFRDKTAMEVALKNKQVESVSELIIGGASCNNKTKAYAVTQTAKKGDAQLLERLLQKGCNANHYCMGELPPLMQAIVHGHEESARILLAKGAIFNDVSCKSDGVSCYEVAKKYNQLPLFLKLGGSVDMAPSSIQGRTININYSKANSIVYGTERPDGFIDCNSDYIPGARSIGITTTTFLPQGKLKHNPITLTYKYTKVAANKALVTFNDSELDGAVEGWELTFISPKTAKVRAWYTGGDVDTSFFSNLTATIQ